MKSEKIILEGDPLRIADQDQASILDLFEERVNKTPHVIAAIDEKYQLTYLELHHQSNQLANFLWEQGVRQNVFVGICVKSDCQLLVGILGILKAGGVYFPLDPSYPPERLQYMLNDAKPSILLTHHSFLTLFSSFQATILTIKNEWLEKSFRFPKHLRPQISIVKNDLAYIVYTSGSTGYPKGILITHGCFPQIISARIGYYPQDIIGLLIGSISFDASILTIFHLLFSGGTICIPPFESLGDMDQIINFIQDHTINFILTVPYFYTKMLEKSRLLLSLRSVSLAGENIPIHIPKLHTELAPNAILYNEYGPSEYAIGTSIAKIYDPISLELNPITIGKLLPNTEVYILNEHLQEVSKGEKGEFFIGGVGLACGYLNKPHLTSEKFLPIELPGEGLKRLYRSGDFGRYLPNGDLEFLGRVDHQVKIRGVRIELGEIEHAICQYQGVKESALIVREDKLIAFYTAQCSESIQNKLHSYLVDFLPSYMLPSLFIQLEFFPYTSIGKIDREALQHLVEQDFSAKNREKQLPSLEMEQGIFDIWQKVLGIDEFGVHDNFFDLNGTSLQILIIQQMLQEQYNLSVNILDFYHYPTIYELAQHLTLPKEMTASSQTRSLDSSLGKRKAAFQRLKNKAIEKDLIQNGH